MRIDATLPRTRKLAVLMAALLAFVWQGVVTQSHVHPRPEAARTMPAHTTPAGLQQAGLQQADAAAPETPANCPICQEIAHTGAYLLPTLAALPVPPQIAAWHFIAPTLAPARTRRSHAWQSRAPPILQA